MQHLLQSKFKLGADASAAAGPVGRNAQAATDLTMRAQILTYSRSRGLFARRLAGRVGRSPGPGRYPGLLRQGLDLLFPAEWRGPRPPEFTKVAEHGREVCADAEGSGTSHASCDARSHRYSNCRADDDFGSSGDPSSGRGACGCCIAGDNRRACGDACPSERRNARRCADCDPCNSAGACDFKLLLAAQQRKWKSVDSELVVLAVAAATAFFLRGFRQAAVRFTMDATENFPSFLRDRLTPFFRGATVSFRCAIDWNTCQSRCWCA